MPRTPAARAGIAALAVTPALLLAFAGHAGAATSAPRLAEDSLSPTRATPGHAVTATLRVHATSSACTTVRSLGVAVRDAKGNNVDFPGWKSNVRVCPGGLTVNAGSRAFAAGRYSVFGAYLDGSGWHNLTAKTLTVAAAASTPAPAPTPASTPTPTSTPTSTPTGTASTAPSGSVAGGSLAWDEEFNSLSLGSRWKADTSSAYRYGTHNPDDNKLDWLDPNDVSVSGGVATFTAQPSGHTLENGKQAWTTGLLTTEGSQENFQVRTGDYVEARVKLPSVQGAWPALWTWKNGGSEIDSFEYHPDNPNLLELTNHVNSGQKYWTDSNAVKPGGWVTIGTKYGANSVDWYVNGVKVYSDGTGVGANWSANLILNLSVVAGQYHPAPSSSTPITFSADYVRVYR
ncbi:glycoside hydrolase family 16 protein [Streptacidiphilus monticola]|uniref:GH16 domain-containing protein n=1 Tax=Streptacidiphilus monticola TaxID=2161674 RepID=A0ABW1GBF0_9ACTN